MDLDNVFPDRERSLSACCAKIRVALMGAKGVGKSSIARRYVEKRFDGRHKKDVDKIYIKRVGGQELEIVDTCDHDMSPIIASSDAFFLIYAVDDETSFDHVANLREMIISRKGGNVPIIIVGNKSDLTIRSVHSVVADCVVSIDWENIHCEVAAKTNHNITLLFQELLFQFNFRKNLSTMGAVKESPLARRRTLSTSIFRRNTIISFSGMDVLISQKDDRVVFQAHYKRNGLKSRLINFFRPQLHLR